MLESLSAIQSFLPPKRVLFPECAAWERGGRATARPGLGSELRIMWQRLSTFFADLGNLKEPLCFFREAGLGAPQTQAATSHHSISQHADQVPLLGLRWAGYWGLQVRRRPGSPGTLSESIG